MNFLENSLNTPHQRQQYQNFVNRCELGHPAEGYADDEVMERYHEVGTQLPAQEHDAAARDMFDRLSPEERTQFGTFLQERAHQSGVIRPELQGGARDQFQSTGFLARLTGQLLGGGAIGSTGSGGSLLSNPVAKAALAGIASMAVKRMLSGR